MAALNGHASVVPLLLADPGVEVNAKNKARISHAPIVHIVCYDQWDEGALFRVSSVPQLRFLGMLRG